MTDLRRTRFRSSPPARLFTRRGVPGLSLLLVLASGCDGGLAPPEEIPTGSIRAVITYTGTWPPADSLFDLRFVAMRFVPQDTADFLQLNRITFSDSRLPDHVERDTVVLEEVPTGVYVYSGVAVKFGEDLFAWRPVGLYTGDGGIFDIRAGESTDLLVSVDFDDPPSFPPDAR